MSVFALFCLTFLLGCFCGIKFATINILFLILSVTFVFLVKIVIFKAKTYTNLFVLGTIFVFVCGVGLGIYTDHKTFNHVYPLCGNDIIVNGRVTDVEGNTFVVDTKYGNIRAYNYVLEEVEKGDTVKLSGNFSVYSASQYNGDFDQRLYYAVSGIVGYIECYKISVTGHTDKFSLADYGSDLREKLKSVINETKASGRSKGFVTALLTGEGEHMNEDVKEAFNITGTSHVTAVSGLHVGIFLSFFVLFTKGLRRNKIAHVIFVMVLVAMYMVFIGERASVLRAGIMTVMGYCVFAIRRRSDPLINLVLAGIIICMVNPYYVIAPGFQMSFIATLGIVIFAEHFKYQLISVPFIATLFMLPIILYYYGSFSVTTVFANIAVVFLLPVIILMGYIGCMIPYFMYISLALAELVIIIVEFFASMVFLHFTLPAPGIRQFVMYFMVIWAAYYAVAKRKFGKMAMILFAVVVIYVNGVLSSAVVENGTTVRFINSGIYNMHHITTENGNNILVDCSLDADDYVAKSGVENIFAVVITDTANSRYKGLEKLCSTGSVKYVLLPSQLEEKNLNLEKCEVLYYNQDGYKFYADNVNFRFCSDQDEKSLLIQVYDHVIAVPLDKTVCDIEKCTVMSVSDKCTDCNVAADNNTATYYIHPTYRYKYYDHENKYITSQVGMVSIVFKKNAQPEVTLP